MSVSLIRSMSSVALRRPLIRTPLRKQAPSATKRIASFSPAFFSHSFALSAGHLFFLTFVQPRIHVPY